MILLGLTLASAGQARADSESAANAAPKSVGDGPAQVSGSGTLSTSVALELPPPRGDALPVPVSVAYSGNGDMGAAGAGWDVPVSSIRISNSHSHRKPLVPAAAATSTSVPARFELQLLGQGYLLRPVDRNVYMPLVADEFLLANQRFGATSWWEIRDAHGHVYTFSLLPNAPDPGHFYLTEISDADGNYVTLTYDVRRVSPTAGLNTNLTPSTSEISLTGVGYSYAGTCPKTRIELRYGNPNGGRYQLAYNVRNDGAANYLRERVLRSLVVWSHDTTSCNETAAQRLRTYTLDYKPSMDHGLPQLAGVSLWPKGVDPAAPGSALAIPQTSYEYGSTSEAGGVAFVQAPAIAIPSAAAPALPLVSRSRDGDATQILRDFTGDGVPDLLVNASGTVKLFAGKFTTAGQPTTEFDTVGLAQTYLDGNTTKPIPWPDDQPGPMQVDYRTNPNTANGLMRGYRFDKMVDAVDWNGDGRLDLVSALMTDTRKGDGKPRYWTVYLNLPAISDPNRIVWTKRQIDVTAIYADMEREMWLSAKKSEPNPAFIRECQDSCRAACPSDCRQACEEARRDCPQQCTSNALSCNATCSTGGTCDTTCDITESQCKGGCNSSSDTHCASDCEDTAQSCHIQCDDDVEGCEGHCDDVERGCNSNCSSPTELNECEGSCEISCRSGCVSVCTRQPDTTVVSVNPDSVLPLGRTTKVTHSGTCKAYTKGADGKLHLGKVDCPEAEWLTEWQLEDVNGDSFPDLVRNGVPATPTEATCDMCPDVADANSVPSRCRLGCTQGWIDDMDAQATLIKVYYHTGIALSTNGARWTSPAETIFDGGLVVGEESPRACGLERARMMGTGSTYLACGLRDLDGDGIVDYVTETSRPFRWEVSPRERHQVALRGTGALPRSGHPAFDFRSAFLLPGTLDRKSWSKVECHGGDSSSVVRATSQQVTGLVDLNHDGRPDFIHLGVAPDKILTSEPLDTVATPYILDGLFRTPNLTRAGQPVLGLATGGNLPPAVSLDWYVQFNNGATFGPPQKMNSPGGSFALGSDNIRCDGDKQVVEVTSSVIDIDGDGAPDVLGPATSTSLRVVKLSSLLGGQMGVPAAGRLTAISNSQGGVFRVAYESIKSYAAQANNHLPGPQNLVASTRRTFERGLAQGAQETPTYYLYGGASLEYDPFYHRFSAPGYTRTVEYRDSDPSSPRPAYYTAIVRAKTQLLGETDSFVHYLGLGYKDSTYRVDAVANPLSLLSSTTLDADSNGADVSRRAYVVNGNGTWAGAGLADECAQVNPYSSLPPVDFCMKSAIAYGVSGMHWRGDEAPTPLSTAVARRAVVSTSSQQVDCFARPTQILEGGDLGPDDDLTHTLAYAGPACGATLPNGPLRLDAVASSTLSGGGLTLGVTTTYYDGLPFNAVGKGHPTRTDVKTYATANGALRDSYTRETRSYDAFGALSEETSFAGPRDPGASRTVRHLDFDAFHVAHARTSTSGTGVAAPLVETVVYDPVSLLPLATTDANGVTTRTAYDGFGRPVLKSAIDPASGSEYALQRTIYRGDFPSIPGEFGAGRHVTQLVYQAWTPVSSTSFADVDTTTTYYDELGRVRFVHHPLGSDYQNQTLVSDWVEYDGLGRKRFAADPFLANDNLATLYGTTTTYFPDGTTRCTIRAERGLASATPDVAHDVFPTCVERVYQNRQLLVRTRGPNELQAATVQAGAYDEVATDGVGRVRTQRRVKNDTMISFAEQKYDRLGKLVSITRSATPWASTGLVTWTFERDTDGNVVRKLEPGLADQTSSYDAWGNRRRVSFNDAAGEHVLGNDYDGLGRRTHASESVAGVLKSELFAGYDAPAADPRHDFGRNLRGRLAYARKSNGETVFFSYDFLGQPTTEGRPFDETASAPLVLQSTETGPNGRIDSQAFTLPDSPDHAPESALYTYDSAGRMKGVDWLEPRGAETLWTADTMSARGQLLQATLGNGAVEAYTYESAHRRLLKTRSVTHGASTSRFEVIGYDGDGRQLGLKETRIEGPQLTEISTIWSYDESNHLASEIVDVGGTITSNQQFGYDGLGNLASKLDMRGQRKRVYVRAAGNPDQLCRVASVPFGSNAPPTPTNCTFVYDQLGGVTSDDVGRTLEYDSMGRPQIVHANGYTIETVFGLGGAPVRVNIDGPVGEIVRRDRRYGALLERSRLDGVDVWERRIPGPGGTIATVRRTPAGRVILYRHGDANHDLQFTSDASMPAQRLEFDPWGVRRTDTGVQGSATYTKYQWNGGDALDPTGLVRLGARLYDPALGRFLQRDPLFVPRKADEANPYAYSHNDPVNKSDPTGLDPMFPSPGFNVYSGLQQLGAGIGRNPWAQGAVGAFEWATGQVENLYHGAGKMAEYSFRLMVDPYGTLYGTYEDIAMIYDQNGGGWDGVAGVINTVNPVYNMLVSGYEAHEAWDRGDYRGAVKHGLDAGANAAGAFGLAELGAGAAARGLGGAGAAAERFSFEGASAAEDVRYMRGRPVEATPKTYEMALDPEVYMKSVADKYGINLRGSGQTISMKFNPEMNMANLGKVRAATPNIIEIGPAALVDEGTLANTIAHELNHARDFLKGGNAPEPQAYSAGNALQSYIDGDR